jgi:CRISPR-associated protein Cmr1
MNTIKATFRIVTPMFMSGANQQSAEIRAPSVKGALRFWWRALNWSRVFEQENKDNDLAIKRLSREESLLFGAATSATGIGQSAILLRVKDQPTRFDTGKELLIGKPSQYLGIGLFTMGNSPQRNAIPADNTFTLIVSYRKLNSSQHAQVLQAIKAIGLWAGLGSRSRNGFGSVAVKSVKLSFDCSDKYLAAVKELVNSDKRCSEKPPFTAFSMQTEIKALPVQSTAQQALDSLASRYEKFRRDHKNDKRKRYFGLPLKNYDTENRRASPLFFHVHPIGDQFLPVVMKIPADFHPNYKVEDYSLVDQFMATL